MWFIYEETWILGYIKAININKLSATCTLEHFRVTNKLYDSLNWSLQIYLIVINYCNIGNTLSNPKFTDKSRVFIYR